MKRIVFTVMLCLFIQVWAQAQIKISGTVTDVKGGAPLVGASVHVVEEKRGTVTDESGQYRISIPEKGSYTVRYSYVGYQDKTVTVNASKTINVALRQQYELEEIIIQSVRASSDAPIAQSTVEKVDIDKVYRGQDAPFLLEELTPSIVTYSESGTRTYNYSQMRLRGIDMQRINYTLNGIPLNDMIDQGVFFSNFPGFGNSIQSVQVQRGVGTSSNGVASYAGSVNFESINLQKSEEGTEVQLGAGSFNSYRGSAEFSTGVMDNNTAFYGRFSRIYSDGYRYNTFTNAHSFFVSGGYFGEKDLIKINAFSSRSKNGLGYAASPLSQIENDPRHNPLNENDHDDFGQQFIQLQHTHTFSDRTSLVSSLYYGGAGGDYFYSYRSSDSVSSVFIDNAMETVADTVAQINYPLQNDHYGAMSNFHTETPDGVWEIDAGVHGYTFRRDNWESLSPDLANPYYDESSRKDELATFAKVQYSPVSPLTIYGDLQYRTLKMTIMPDYSIDALSAPASDGHIVWKWQFLNPKIGVTYDLQQGHQVYASFGRSGREPTKIDIFSGAFEIYDGNYDAASNTNSFDPEFVNDFEGGYRLAKQDLNLQANLFYMDFKDEIAPFGDVGPFGVNKRDNISSSYRAGLELDWNWQTTKRLNFNGNATYMKSEVESYSLANESQVYTNNEQAYSPNWIMNGNLNYQIIDNVEVGVAGRYVSEQYMTLKNEPKYTIPEFFVMDLNAQVGFGNNHSFRLQVNNVLDNQYYSYGTPVDTDGDFASDSPGYFVNAPINVFGTLTMRF